ncbi:hypothetical protein B0H11DRAFT_1989306, partial [Mycena galericulata]
MRSSLARSASCSGSRSSLSLVGEVAVARRPSSWESVSAIGLGCCSVVECGCGWARERAPPSASPPYASLPSWGCRGRCAGGARGDEDAADDEEWEPRRRASRRSISEREGPGAGVCGREGGRGMRLAVADGDAGGGCIVVVVVVVVDVEEEDEEGKSAPMPMPRLARRAGSGGSCREPRLRCPGPCPLLVVLLLGVAVLLLLFGVVLVLVGVRAGVWGECGWGESVLDCGDRDCEWGVRHASSSCSCAARASSRRLPRLGMGDSRPRLCVCLCWCRLLARACGLGVSLKPGGSGVPVVYTGQHTESNTP